MESPKDEFERAKKELLRKRDHFNKEPESWKSFRQNTWIFDNSNAWSFLYEIIQNASDVKATSVAFSLCEDGCLEIQHNGKKPLDFKSVRGLCGFSLSSKDLRHVGFMGIGFKSFLGFFSKVVIGDSNIRFSIEAPLNKSGRRPNIKNLYSPTWIDEPLEIDHNMKTIFRFESPREESHRKIAFAFETFDPIFFAVLGKRGLKNLSLQGKEYIITEKDEGVKIEIDDGDSSQSWNYLVLETIVPLDEEATQELKDRRDWEEEKPRTVKRSVRLVKELIVERDDSNEIISIIPKEMETGQMFCLVPLGKKFPFPFKIGIDTDWLIEPTRTHLVPESEGRSWHKTLLSGLPKLIRQYFSNLPEVLSVPERKACLSIFPTEEDEIDPALNFLETGPFYELMKKVLSECNFILCADGILRSPTEVRDIPKKPEGMSKPAYDKFTQNCFSCHILNRDAISKPAIDYLWNKLGFLSFPNSNEINEKEIQEMWNPDSPEDYLHILDILHDIVDTEEDGEAIIDEHGPKVVPATRKGDWTSLRGSQMVFLPTPKSTRGGLEKPLYDRLVAKFPSLNGVTEVHDTLKEIKIYKPGWKWKSAAKPLSTELEGKIQGLKLPEDELHVIAMYRYALRSNMPEFVSTLHTVSGCKRAKECLIGPPFGHELMGKLVPDNVLSERIRKASTNYSTENVLKFLKKTGASSLVPILDEKPVNRADAKIFVGKEPSDYSTSGNYTAVDWKWIFSLGSIEDANALGKYLGGVAENNELKLSMTKAAKYRKSTFVRYTTKTDLCRISTSWLSELRDVAWVPCADGVFRKPSESAIASPDEEKGGKHILLDLGAIEFYISIGIGFGANVPDGDLPRLQYWKTNLASNHEKLFQNVLERLLEGNK